MDFKLSKQHLLQQKLYRDFAEAEIRPIAQEMDETETFSMDLLGKLHKYGLMGIPFSRAYGGSGGDYLGFSLCMEEVSKIDGATGLTMSVHSLACSCIDNFGTEEQKQRFLRPLVDGSKTGCFGLTEPNAGSDAAGQQSKAVLYHDKYTINGTKIFTTNSGFADTFVMFAMTDKSKGIRGISAFLVEKGAPGLAVGPNIRRMGVRASSNCEVSYENVEVPASNRLGKEGDGFKIAMKALDGGRIGIAAQAVGLAQGALNEAVKYAKERKQFGKRISSFQSSQFKIADLQTRIDAARLMTHRAAAARDNGENYSSHAAMAKLFASRMANDVCRECVQLMGGYGYCREYPVERALRDAKITEIYEGTSEVMQMVIAGAMKVF
ncbi:MAG: acyl-CoA dehydrogenase family protein [Clostridiales bacterium]|nr:acyl-CoA dehydrogenase family protein [Clostridiales bacterium]